MFNVLYQLAQDLKAQGVLSKPRDNSLKTISSPSFLWIGLQEKGNPEIQVEENSGRLYKILINNQNSWPAINASLQAPDAPSFDRKTSEEEGYKTLVKFVQALDQEELRTQCEKIVEDLKNRSKRASEFLKKDSLLAKSAAATSEALKNEELSQELPKLILQAILDYSVAIQEPKAGKKFLAQVFSFGKKKAMNLPIVIGLDSEHNALTNGSMVLEALESKEESQESSDEEGLFGKVTQRPVLSGYPMMASAYYPVSRAEDFPATHGYFGGGFAPVSDNGIESIRAALDYITAPNKENILHTRLSIGKKKYHLLACPKQANQEEKAKAIIEGLYQDPFTKLSEEAALEAEKDFESSAGAIFDPEEETPENPVEITLIVIKETLQANLQIAYHETRDFQSWRKILTDWKTQQVLPNGWRARHGISPARATCLLQSERAVRYAFSLANGSLKSNANKQSPETKGFDMRAFLKPIDEVPLTQWLRLQQNLLRLIGKRVLPTLTEKAQSDPKAKDSIDIFDLQRAVGLLILTTNQIERHMTDNPVNENPAFLIGQCLQELNNLEQAYRNEREVSRGQKPTAAPANMRGSKIVSIAERPNIALTMEMIGKNAKAYLDHAQNMTSKKMMLPEGERKWSNHERRLQGAANSFRELCAQIAEKTQGLTKVPTTRVEIQQHAALVHIGLNARKPRKEKPAEETPAETNPVSQQAA